MNGIYSIWDLLSFDESMSPDEVIHRVRMNVLTLIEKYVLSEKPTILIRVGRKGAHLVGPYDSRIEEKGFLTCTYRLLSNNRISESSRSLEGIKEPVILITDTIHTGEELKYILLRLKSEKVKVSKIFCYSKHQKGVENLVKTGLIKQNKIIALFSASSEEEYMRECKELLVFFRSRIEPMDPDACYNTYNLNKQVSTKEFEKIVVPILEEIFGNKIIVKRLSDSGFASNIREL